MTDVVVVGGGVIGLSLAYELAGQGVAVTVFEQGAFGREASWAGAGILAPGNPAQASDPQAKLRAESHRLWPQLSAELLERTGIDNGFRNCGGIEVRTDGAAEQLQEDIIVWRNEGVEVEELTLTQLFEVEPALNHSIVAAYRLPELSQVRNPRHLKALIAGCAARGVKLLPGKLVVGFDVEDGKVLAVRMPDETCPAGQFCVAGGAWTKQLMANLGIEVPIEPIRGQIVLLSAQPLPIRHVIEFGSRYLVPRPDGRILVGSTEERVGFEKQNTAGAMAGLIEFATDLVPSLSAAKYERAWSGLRPGTVDDLPYLGCVPAMKNLFLASGHFRSGLQRSPATALLVRQVMLGQETSISLDAFACDRHRL